MRLAKERKTQYMNIQVTQYCKLEKVNPFTIYPCPKKIRNAHLMRLLIIFYHPDSTVGTGISPVQPCITQVADFTAGREFHPAPKTNILFTNILSHFLKKASG